MENRQFKGIWLPAELYLRKDLSLEQKIIYAEIDSFTSQGMDCYFSLEYLADFINCTTRQISRHLKELKDKKLINIRFDGRNNHYSINRAYTEIDTSSLDKMSTQTRQNVVADWTKCPTNNTNIIIQKNNTNNTNKLQNTNFDYSMFTEGETNAFKNWIQHMKEKRKSLTPSAMEGIKNKLLTYKKDDISIIDAISHSIAGNFSSIYPYKLSNQYSSTKLTVQPILQNQIAHKKALEKHENVVKYPPGFKLDK